MEKMKKMHQPKSIKKIPKMKKDTNSTLAPCGKRKGSKSVKGGW